MGSKGRYFAGVLSLAAILAAACGSTPTTTGSTATGKPIIIGVDQDSSGPSAFYSTIATSSIYTAVSQINKAGGVINNRPFQIIAESDSGQPSQAPTVVQHLIQEGAVAIIMNSGSASTLQVKSLLSTSKVVGMAPLNTNPNIPLPPDNAYAFSASATQQDLNHVTTAAMKAAGVTKPGFIYDDTATIAGLISGTNQDYVNAGMPFVDSEKVPANATDVSAQMARLVSKGADGIFLLTLGGPVDSVVLNNLYDVAPKMKKFAGQQLCGEASNKLAKPEALDGTYCASQITLNNPRTKEADTVLRATLGTGYAGMGTYYAQGYQGPYTLMKAIQLAGTADDPSKIKDGMEKITKLTAYWGGPNFTLSYSSTKHNGSDGLCAYEFDVFKGNVVGGPWSTYQPTCAAS
jgi:branched-chain amino acid transport system substrate-binding protein